MTSKTVFFCRRTNCTFKNLIGIFNRMTKEEKGYLKKNKELPPMKLTKEELAVMKGGKGGPMDDCFLVFANLLKR